MRFDCITLFPELLAPLREHGIGRRAFASGQAQLQCWNPRDFTEDTYRRVDDRTYGGGPGMVMMAEPLARTLAAIESARAADASVEVATPGLRPRAPVVHFSPAGQRLDQALVQGLAAGPGAVLVCGRYEGIDQRFVDRHVDLEVSLGDFVLSGGELPAMALIDAVVRLLPGVLGDPSSHEQDSFSDGLLDCPHYSRPEQWGDDPVPAVLLSGHHRAIAQWRREQSLRLTQTRRPDLIRAARAEGRLSKADEAFLRSLGPVEPA